jgi:hypothetical protein
LGNGGYKLTQASAFNSTVSKIVFLLVNIAKDLFSNDLAQLNNDNLADIRANTGNTADYTFDTRANTDNIAANSRNSAINSGNTAANTQGILEGGRELFNRFGETKK